MPEFERVADLDEVPNLGRKEVIINDEIPALLLRVDSVYYCIEDVCTHDGQPLTDGEFTGTEIVCSRHGARFDVVTGKATALPARLPIRVFDVEIRDDGIYVRGDD
ncbi:MAG TPA: Rieske 2Fe-2S domain-containing protein [Planctomicrobium sp.]|nr:Rieske 2Fe-2S domain-containing protein [Planctomicrobium sp.]